MSLTDPIGDMITRIKNAQMRNHKKVELPERVFDPDYERQTLPDELYVPKKY